MKRNKTILSLSIACLLGVGSICYAATGVVKTNGQALRLREQANTSSNIIEQVQTGTSVEILEKSGDWYKIKYNEKTGYAYAEYIVENETTNEGPKASGEINLYIMPLITSSVVNKINVGENIQIEKQLNDWAYITNGTIAGWARLYLVNGGQIEQPEQKQEQEKEPEQTENSEQQEEQSNIETEKLEEKPEIEEETQTQQKPTVDITNKPVETEENTPKIEKGYINVSSATVRKEATTNSEVVTYLLKGAGVTILAETENWYKIQYFDYTGYVAKTLISENL